MSNEDKIKSLGRKIQFLRKQLGYSQEVFAKKIKKTPAHLSKIERGEKTPSLSILFAIADNLQVPANELFKGISSKESDTISNVKERLNAILSIAGERKAKLILKVAQEIQASE